MKFYSISNYISDEPVSYNKNFMSQYVTFRVTLRRTIIESKVTVLIRGFSFEL